MMAAILATITAGTTRPTAAITTAGTITRLTRAAIAGTGRRPATARAALSKPERNRQRKAGKTAAVPAVARSNLLPALLRQRRCKPAAPRKPLTSQWRPGPPLHSVAPEADAAKSSLCYRVPNLMKHVCVAARIGDGKAPGEGNSRSIAKTSNEASADSGCNPSGWHEFWPMALSKGPLLRMTKPQDFLLALSQNRDSASRVSLCYGL